MMQRKRELPFVTILYGFAVVLVVFGHSHPLHTDWPYCLQAITEFIYIFHMPLFFLISGILISYTAQGRDVWKWWGRKVRKLLLPYVLLTLLAWLPKSLLGSYMNDDMRFSFVNLVRILLIPREGIWGHFWFIPVYLILCLICAELWKVLQPAPKILWGGVWLIALALNLWTIKTAWLGIEDVTQMLVYALTGMYLSEWLTGLKGNTQTAATMAVSLAGALLFYPAREGLLANRCICALMLCAMVSVSIICQRREMRWARYIGQHAFTVYIYSWPVQVVMEMLIVVVLKGAWYVSYPLMFASGLMLPLALYEVYIRKMKRNWFLDGMIGGK